MLFTWRFPASRHPSPRFSVWCLLGCVLLALFGLGMFGSANSSLAQAPATTATSATSVEEEDEDAPKVRPPGLLTTYQSGDIQFQRIEEAPAFIGDGLGPRLKFAAGSGRITWTGLLFIRSPGAYQFQATLRGKLTARLGERTLLDSSANSEKPASINSEPVELEYGEHPLRVELQPTDEQPTLRMYWSSDTFPLEPLPPSVLFVEQVPSAIEQRQQADRLLEGARCQLCHRDDRESQLTAPSAPDLSRIGHEVSAEWLNRWLLNPRDWSQHAQMPDFQFTPEQARQITAYLQSVSGPAPAWIPPAKQKSSKTPLPEPVPQGKLLVHSLGCLACHALDGIGATSPIGGGELTRIGAKHSAEWLRTWLTAPEKLKAKRRMPHFALESAEVEAIVAYLQTLKSPTDAGAAPLTIIATTAADIKAGEQLVQQARCGACHQLAQHTEQWQTPGRLRIPDSTVTSTMGCMDSRPGTPFQPRYAHLDQSPELRDSLLAAARQPTSDLFDAPAERLLRWNHCLSCHPRGTTFGMAGLVKDQIGRIPELAPESSALVPPSLNAVGDKLLPEALAQAVAGKLTPARLTWSRIRMPRFSHTEEEVAQLVRYFQSRDQLPSQPDHPAFAQIKQQPSQALVDGTALLAAQGFSCTACHKVGKFEPRNVALGTRGSDLQGLARRMRPEYFLRWTRGPLRVVTDSEMPGFVKPIDHVLDGKIETQLAAVWHALNSPSLVVPTDPSAIQQVVTVESEARARLIRDVFSLMAQSGETTYIPRSFAVGLNNRHNVLFDLDRWSITQVWLGTLARQKTQGKSWYWEPGDVPLLKQPLQLELLDSEQRRLSVTKRTVRLQNYHHTEAGVETAGVWTLSQPDAPPRDVALKQQIAPLVNLEGAATGWQWRIEFGGLPPGSMVSLRIPDDGSLIWTSSGAQIQVEESPQSTRRFGWAADADGTATLILNCTTTLKAPPLALPLPPAAVAENSELEVVPGFQARELPLPRSIMPTAITFRPDGTLAFASLKGHVYLARDKNGDGQQDDLQLFEEGLAAPYGLLADGESLVVSHKPELLRLIDQDGDGICETREVVATGWGYNDNYHDWTHGLVRDKVGRWYVGLGSDYAQPERPVADRLWRGKILRIDTSGQITPIAGGFRYPTGLALSPEDELFVTDNQGVQNTFNELNHVSLKTQSVGTQYGVPSLEDPRDAPASPPAVQIPHPWTRSVNGIFFLPPDWSFMTAAGKQRHPFAGHLIGCEYDTHFLVRFTLQQVNGVYQGAVYPFSREQVPAGQPNFEGSLCGAVSPTGDLYIGNIHDSGWLGGRNVGNIVRITPRGEVPVGIREVRATASGFEVHFTQPVSVERASRADQYSLTGYRRIWQGAYATPDSDRQEFSIQEIQLATDRRTATLRVKGLRAGLVYELNCRNLGEDSQQALFPATAAYTLHQIPE